MRYYEILWRILLAMSASCPVNTNHLYNICTMQDQRRRRWAGVVQMLYKIMFCVCWGCVVRAGRNAISLLYIIESNGAFMCFKLYRGAGGQCWASTRYVFPALNQRWLSVLFVKMKAES